MKQKHFFDSQLRQYAYTLAREFSELVKGQIFMLVDQFDNYLGYVVEYK